MDTLRKHVIRLAFENPGMREHLLPILAAEDEHLAEDKEGVTMRRRRRGPGAQQNRVKDRKRKRMQRKSPANRKREQRLHKKRVNKAPQFRNMYASAVLLAFENPELREYLLPILAHVGPVLRQIEDADQVE